MTYSFMKKNTEVWFAVGVVLLAAVLRLIPHAPNVSLVLAATVFAGATVRRYWLAALISLGGVIITDLLFGLMAAPGHGGHLFYDGVSMVYAAYVVSALIGWAFHRSTFFAGTFSSVAFFVLSNYGVWRYAGLYPQTMNGLVDCFVLALPFFHQTLLSTVLGAKAFEIAFRLLNAQKTRWGIRQTEEA